MALCSMLWATELRAGCRGASCQSSTPGQGREIAILKSKPSDASVASTVHVSDGLTDRVALITGGSRGIGLACAVELARAGARVVITGRSPKSLEAARDAIGERCTICPGDASKEHEIDQCLQQAMETHGRIDILVNNAGGPLQLGPMLDLPAENLDATLKLNLRGPYLWIRAAWRSWMREHGGVILNIASLGGISLQPGMGAYSLSKAALLHMTRILAAELSPRVRVNAIAPGIVRTDATLEFIDSGGPSMPVRLPLQRFGDPEDVAQACRFLVSDSSSWITGETLVVDGGSLVQWGRIRRAPATKASWAGQ
jgi:NAD(P)-dependent dehydrogenase (short-subunit alcohol dehydrogenase family)